MGTDPVRVDSLFKPLQINVTMSEEKKNIESKKEYKTSASYWMDVHFSEFDKESDRAAVILTASLIDNTTEGLLKAYFVAAPSSGDELFSGPNAPLSTSEARINLCYRLGLISSRFCRDLHLIRKIRNRFAHNIHGCDFNSADVKSRVQELVKSFEYGSSDPEIKKAKRFSNGVRGEFLMVSSWLLYTLNQKVDGIKAVKDCKPEWGYNGKTA